MMRRLLAVGLAAALAWQAGPIVGPGPCHSDTEWGCYEYRVFMPFLQRGS